jgi:hypothetical protein
VLQREPAGRAEALEAGELRLDGDAGRRRGLDQREAVGQDRGRRLQPGHDAGPGRGVAGLAHAAGRVLGL